MKLNKFRNGQAPARGPLYALSTDYDKESGQTKHFFANLQNKLHWAITGKTAAKIIYTESDATKLYMGLKTWKDAPEPR